MLGGSPKDLGKAKRIGKRISDRVSRRRKKWKKRTRFGRGLNADEFESAPNPAVRRLENLPVKKRRSARSIASSSSSSPPTKQRPRVESRADFGHRSSPSRHRDLELRHYRGRKRVSSHVERKSRKPYKRMKVSKRS